MSKRVALIGTGLIGRAWAIAFARGGYDVVLYKRSPEGVPRAFAFIDSVLGDLARYGLLGGARPEQIRARMATANTLEDALPHSPAKDWCLNRKSWFCRGFSILRVSPGW